jgi:hypothetical protein
MNIHDLVSQVVAVTWTWGYVVGVFVGAASMCFGEWLTRKWK